MQFTTIFTVLTAAAVASASQFTGYNNANYQGGEMINLTWAGKGYTMCADIYLTHDNTMSSYKWVSTPGCTFYLYDAHNCVGSLLDWSSASRNRPVMTSATNNKASSVRISCW